MDVPTDLLEPATARRLERALAGSNVARRVTVQDLLPGTVGILDVEVRGITPTRPYNRKRGGHGVVARITLGDATGEIELVLWDEETSQVATGQFRPGARLRIAGATVKAGFRGGVELGLGAARVEPAPVSQGQTLSGILEELGSTRVLGSGPSAAFQADAKMRCDGAIQQVVASGPALLGLLAAGTGARVALSDVCPNPAVADWWWTSPTSTCTPLPEPRNP